MIIKSVAWSVFVNFQFIGKRDARAHIIFIIYTSNQPKTLYVNYNIILSDIILCILRTWPRSSSVRTNNDLFFLFLIDYNFGIIFVLFFRYTGALERVIVLFMSYQKRLHEIAVGI